ncbi:WD40 repeat protein [Phaffia rhodozyma]|uniref:WD40 repeat protein n=1 Tax=Phaffia rhodozyma TaxID=264483 RepID=A0A0F7SSH5_PHARH|nr:WD40 repeat protein [Phaffia rhodozyma]
MAPQEAMSDQIVSLPAHTPGLTRAAFSTNGQLIFTAGKDTIVRIFETAAGADVEPRLLEEHSDEVNWLHCSKTHLITACSDSSLRLFSLPINGDPSGQITFAGLLTRASGMAIRCAVFDPSGMRVACASDDLHIKILPVSMTSLRTPLVLPSAHSHTKPPRSLTWSPDGTILLSSGCDGKLSIWNTSLCVLKPNTSTDDDEFDDDTNDDATGNTWNPPTLLKSLEGMFEVTEPEDIKSTTSVWHPSGKWFVVPTKSHEILQIQRDSWSKMGLFENGGHNSSVTELCFSPNGRYLGSSGVDGKILIWEVSTKKVIASYVPSKSSSSAITSLQFSPTSNILIYADASGTFGRWNDPIPSTFLHPCEIAPSTEASRRARSPLFGDDDDDDDTINNEDVNKPPRKINADDRKATIKKKSRAREEEDDGDDTALGDEDGEELEDEMDDDDRAFLADGDEFEGGYTGWARDEKSNGRIREKEIVSVAKSQPAFQPGSTASRGKKRYLAFNMVGAIDITDQETHNVVNVEFHDTSRRRGFHFQDHIKYDLAALGEKGAVFASTPDSVNPISTLHYRLFDTWSSTSSEWTHDLPKSERVVAVAVGGRSSSDVKSSRQDDTTGMVVAATSKGYLRFFSGSGVQRYIWMLGEEVVSMTAGQQELLVVHREGGTSLDGCQNLRFTLVNLESFDIIQEGRLPLPKSTTLKWIGFSDVGNPLIYDSRGIISVLDRFRRPHQARWVPALDTNLLARKEGKDESYWAVGVQDGKFMAVILKGRVTSPYFPRPLISDLDMNIPLLNRENQHGQLEECVVRQRMEALFYRDAQIASQSTYFADEVFRLEIAQDKSLLQLIQTACKADKLARALDAARLLNSTKSIDSAVQIAAFYHLPGLREKITELRSLKEDELYERDQLERRAGKGGRWGNGGGQYVQPGSEFDYVTSNAVHPKTTKPSTKSVPAFAPRPVGGKRTFAATPDPTPVSISSSRLTVDSYAVDEGSREESFIPESSVDVGSESHERGHGDEEELEDGLKRKRTGDTVIDDFPAPPERRKRGNGEGDMAPPLKMAPKNPFAKKDANSAASNPFARSNIGKPVTVGKSTSFFDRIDDARSVEDSKSKDRGKKPTAGTTAVKGSKQTTLFGLPPGQEPVKKKSGRKPLEKNDSLRTVESDDEELDPQSVSNKKADGMGRAQRQSFETDVEESFEDGTETQRNEGLDLEETQVDSLMENDDEEPMMIDLGDEDDVEEAAKENLEPVKNDGVSKLAAFRMKTVA